MARLVELAGFPKGVVNILTTDANTKAVGKEMTQNPKVKKVSFTGSVSLCLASFICCRVF